MGIIIVLGFLALCCLAPFFGADSRRYDERGGLVPCSRYYVPRARK